MFAQVRSIVRLSTRCDGWGHVAMYGHDVAINITIAGVKTDGVWSSLSEPVGTSLDQSEPVGISRDQSGPVGTVVSMCAKRALRRLCAATSLRRRLRQRRRRSQGRSARSTMLFELSAGMTRAPVVALAICSPRRCFSSSRRHCLPTRHGLRRLPRARSSPTFARPACPIRSSLHRIVMVCV